MHVSRIFLRLLWQTTTFINTLDYKFKKIIICKSILFKIYSGIYEIGDLYGLTLSMALSKPLVEVLIPLFMNGHSLCLIIPNETHVGKTETCRNPKHVPN